MPGDAADLPLIEACSPDLGLVPASDCRHVYVVGGNRVGVVLCGGSGGIPFNKDFSGAPLKSRDEIKGELHITIPKRVIH